MVVAIQSCLPQSPMSCHVMCSVCTQTESMPWKTLHDYAQPQTVGSPGCSASSRPREPASLCSAAQICPPGRRWHSRLVHYCPLYTDTENRVSGRTCRCNPACAGRLWGSWSDPLPETSGVWRQTSTHPAAFNMLFNFLISKDSLFTVYLLML